MTKPTSATAASRRVAVPDEGRCTPPHGDPLGRRRSRATDAARPDHASPRRGRRRPDGGQRTRGATGELGWWFDRDLYHHA